MNLVMRTVLTSSQHHLSSDELTETYKAIYMDLRPNFPHCWNEILLRKIIAAALNIVERYGQHTQHESHSQAEHRHFNQLNVLCPLVLHLEYDLGRGILSPDETPTCARDFCLFFIKRAPCRCFDEQKRRLKVLPRTDSCHYQACKKPDSHSNLQECSKCRRTAYCSAECQRKDWPTHKEDCKWLRKMDTS